MFFADWCTFYELWWWRFYKSSLWCFKGFCFLSTFFINTVAITTIICHTSFSVYFATLMFTSVMIRWVIMQQANWYTSYLSLVTWSNFESVRCSCYVAADIHCLRFPIIVNFLVGWCCSLSELFDLVYFVFWGGSSTF